MMLALLALWFDRCYKHWLSALKSAQRQKKIKTIIKKIPTCLKFMNHWPLISTVRLRGLAWCVTALRCGVAMGMAGRWPWQLGTSPLCQQFWGPLEVLGTSRQRLPPHCPGFAPQLAAALAKPPDHGPSTWGATTGAHATSTAATAEGPEMSKNPIVDGEWAQACGYVMLCSGREVRRCKHWSCPNKSRNQQQRSCISTMINHFLVFPTWK